MKHKCRFCDFVSIKRGGTRKHEEIHSSQRLQCDQCEFVTNSHDYLYNHKKKKHNSEVQCDLCPYKTFGSIRTHKQVHHPTKLSEEAGQFKCEHCFYSGKSERGLSYHHQIVHLAAELQCGQRRCLQCSGVQCAVTSPGRWETDSSVQPATSHWHLAAFGRKKNTSVQDIFKAWMKPSSSNNQSWLSC